MDLLEYQIIQSAIAVIVFIVIRFSLTFLINKRRRIYGINGDRAGVIKKIFSFFLLSVFLIILSSIWGLEQSDILIFIASILTVIGVAFFAQWSHLSNITAGVILFFTKDLRLGDQITILEKENDLTGEVKDIGVIFFQIYSKEKGLVSIPNTMMLQRMIALQGRSSKKVEPNKLEK